MARPLRVVRAGGWYHVFSRGLNHMQLYRDDRDREHLLELLEDFVGRYGVRLHAYVLMDTHYHLVVETPEPNLSRAMQWLNLSYAAWFNVRHGRNGPVFQRPFRAVPVENAAWSYELSVYVHLNPLRIAAFRLSKPERKAAAAGSGRPPSGVEVRERLARLRQYRWSSYGSYAGYAAAPPWLTTAPLLDRAARVPAHQAQAYRRHVQSRLRQGAPEPKWEALREGAGDRQRDFRGASQADGGRRGPGAGDGRQAPGGGADDDGGCGRGGRTGQGRALGSIPRPPRRRRSGPGDVAGEATHGADPA